MKRIILHLDMDAFFAQIEERENPQFRGKPIVVGAEPKGGRGRGVVSTANYKARKYGIHSALPISKAFKLCPNAIFLPVNISYYQKVSEKIREIISQALKRKGGKKMEIVSLDEVYLDISFLKSYKEAKNFAQELKKKILKREKLTCTIGIGPNKLVAKIACQKAKPNGLLVITPKKVKSFLGPLDIEIIPGIGPKTAEKLRKIGINKISNLRKLKKSQLKEMFGKVGEIIFERVRGIDEREIKTEKVIKSIGKQYTFQKDTKNPKVIFLVFEKMLREVYKELKVENFYFKTITVICRFSNFETHTKSKTLKEKSKDLKVLEKEAKKLLLRFLVENSRKIRLIGLRVKIC